MKEKRYAIVRVDKSCPNKLENLSAPCITSFKRFDCKNCRYGDTKEQLVHKIAQVIFKTKIERYRRVWKCECSEMEKRDRYKDSLSLAKEIVEFVGVE